MTQVQAALLRVILSGLVPPTAEVPNTEEGLVMG